METRQNAIISALESVAKQEGIINPKIELLEGCEKGNGYAGEKNIAILHGDNKTLEVFIKAAPTDEALKQVLNSRDFYLLETLFYKEVIPTFFKFQEEKKVPKPFTAVIKCLEARTDVDHELILLENAKTLGYQMWDRMKQMGGEHVEFIFAEYGKYHGLSYALKDQRPDEYYSLIKKFPFKAFSSIVNIMLDGFWTMAKKAKLLLDPVKEADLYKPYEKFVERFGDIMAEIGEQRDDYSVIAHGDCWCTNMMFKYATDATENNKPEEMILLDFQLLRECSPVQDLAYFMYCSASKEVYNNLEHYLQVYYKSLSEMVRALGSDPDVVFPYKELKNQWKLYSSFGLIMAVLNLKACVQENNETMELSESLEQTEGGDMLSGFARESKNEAIYQQRLKDLIIHMVKNEFI